MERDTSKQSGQSASPDDGNVAATIGSSMSVTFEPTGTAVSQLLLAEPTTSSGASLSLYQSTSADISITTSQTSSSSTSLPLYQPPNLDTPDLSAGAIAAAVAIPLVFLLAISLLLYRHRRRRSSPSNPNQLEDMEPRSRTGSRTAFLPASIKEKLSHSAHSSTSSCANSTSDIPPPYDLPSRPSTSKTTITTTTTPAVRTTLPSIPHPRVDLPFPHPPPPPPPPETQLRPATARLSRLPSSRSNKSFSSDLYSDTASLHCAAVAVGRERLDVWEEGSAERS